MTYPTKTRIPAPLYAAAGAGDLAYEQLRKLPAVVAELRGKAIAGTTDLRQRAAAGRIDLRERAVATLKAAEATANDLRDKATTADLERIREIALRNATTVMANAQAVYTQLVARGERVVGSGVVQAADTVNSDIEATEAPNELPATPAGVSPITDAAKSPTKAAAKPVKRTRPAADK